MGEWEAGKPKWVQSLGLDDDAMPELVPDMQLKVEEALKVLAGLAHAAATVSCLVWTAEGPAVL